MNSRVLFLAGACVIFSGSVALGQTAPPQSSPTEPTRKVNTCATGDTACLDKFIEIPEIDATTLTEMKVECRDKGPEIFGMPSCDGDSGFFSTVEKAVRHTLAEETNGYYQGKFTDWDTNTEIPLKKPVCNINDGDSDSQLVFFFIVSGSKFDCSL